MAVALEHKTLALSAAASKGGIPKPSPNDG